MTPLYLAFNRGIHLCNGSRLAFERQNTRDFVELGSGKAWHRSQQNSGACLFDDELGSRPPGPGYPYVLWQHDLALGR